MPDFRLKVFHTVAVHLNFSKAAEILYISQPAVSQNIRELETTLDIKLFDRSSKRIELTEAGRIVFKHAESILKQERELIFNLDTLKHKYSGSLKIGASTTVGQYILPAVLAKFHEIHKDVELSLLNDNTEKVESAILNNEIDIAIVEGYRKNSSIKYIPFTKDEIVAIVHTSQPLAQKDEITLKELVELPLILREEGSGSLAVIANKLMEYDIRFSDMNIVLQLGSTESIKSYLAHSNSIALISIHAVTKEIVNGEFKVIDIQDIEIDRNFYFIHSHGQLSGLAEVFLYFMQNNYK